MNIQAEKIELIKLIADIESEKILKKIKNILKSENRMDGTDSIMANPPMAKRFEESNQQIQDGKELYNIEFIEKMKQSEDDVKAGRTTKIEPADIWNLG